MIDDRILIQIRERSFLDLLDLTLLVIRERPLTLSLAAFAGVAPFAALNLWLLADPSFSLIHRLVVLVMETPWATAPLTLVLGDLMFGSQPSPKRYMKRLAVSLPVLFFTQFVLRAILLITVVGYPIVTWRFAFLDEVILLERIRGPRALARARTLGRGFETDLFLRWMAQVALGLTFALCFWTGAESISSTFIGNDLTWYRPGWNDLNGHLFQLAVWIAIAFFAVFRFLSYIDRRIRLEGWELAFRLKEAGRELEERVN
jgi:hypothetical protein